MGKKTFNQQLIKGVQYLRMSTEHQKYSFYNQSSFNQRYAEQHNIELLISYLDPGKSGVSVSGRLGFQQLIDDVVYHRINIDVVLVYDVSRFGRFPDIDESAYYHHLFKLHGVDVIYCAEPMSEDYPEASMYILNSQRIGAAVLSRNLSQKVFAGQVNLIKRGFRQGGTPGFGLRRRLVDEHLQTKCELMPGQRKSLQTDRVILVPGPVNEVETVNLIFDMFNEQSKPERVIASELNRKGICAENGGIWTRGKIHQILTNEKYIGNNVYNRTSFKLKHRFVRNPESEWVRYNNAWQPVVSERKFLLAQEIIQNRSRRLSDDELLTSLKSLLACKGRLSGFLIDEDDFMPSSSVYRSRFGGLLKAYALIGYSPEHDYSYIKINNFLRGYHKGIVYDVIAEINAVYGWVETESSCSYMRVNDEFSLSIIISRCHIRPSGKRQWRIRFDKGLAADITIVVRMDENNCEPLDYYILPAVDCLYQELLMVDMNPFYLELYRFPSLSSFFTLTERTVLMEAI